MISHLDPRFYGSVATRYQHAPIYNLDFLLALYRVPPMDRDIFVDDEGVLVVEPTKGEVSKAILEASSGPVAKGLLDCLTEDEYLFVVRERWLSLVLTAQWEVDLAEMPERRYTTDKSHFVGTTQDVVMELEVTNEQMAMRFKEDREDFSVNPALEDLLVWKGRGRASRIFATITGGFIRSYVVALPVCDDLSNIWQIVYVFTSPELRGKGYGTSALCSATQHLLASGHVPLITLREDQFKGGCESLGYHTDDERLWGMGKRK